MGNDYMGNPDSNISTDNTNRITIIVNEMTNSFQTIHQGKKILVNFITLYLSAVIGYAYYGAFVEQRIREFDNSIISLHETKLLAALGILFAFILFIFGSALLGLVTRTIFGTIKQFKHISYMRKLSSVYFEKNAFHYHCLNPIAVVNLSIKTERSLPFLFSVLNFIIVSSSFFFWALFFPYRIAFTMVLIPLGFLAIYYTDILSKHFSELRIAQHITPLRNEKRVREIFQKRKDRQKERKKYQLFWWLLFICSWLYFFSFYFNFRYIYYSVPISNELLLTQVGSILIISILSFIVSNLKIEWRIFIKISKLITFDK